jgi:hypothetical protein
MIGQAVIRQAVIRQAVIRQAVIRQARAADREAVVEVFLACWTTSYAYGVPEVELARVLT